MAIPKCAAAIEASDELPISATEVAHSAFARAEIAANTGPAIAASFAKLHGAAILHGGGGSPTRARTGVNHWATAAAASLNTRRRATAWPASTLTNTGRRAAALALFALLTGRCAAALTGFSVLLALSEHEPRFQRERRPS